MSVIKQRCPNRVTVSHIVTKLLHDCFIVPFHLLIGLGVASVCSQLHCTEMFAERGEEISCELCAIFR